MKVTAIKSFCFGRTIRKSEVCFTFVVNPENPDKSEFDVAYACLRCSEEETCQMMILVKGITAQ